MRARLYPWLLAIRFKTLTAAFVPVLVATSLVYSMHTFYQAWVSLFALLSAFCIQIATNLLNDAIDFKKGADTEKRIGPQRVTQQGLITEKWVYTSAFLFLFIAFCLGIPLVFRGGIPIIALGLLSLFLAYSYTGGPFPLAYLGLGDLFVILFFGLFAVGGTGYLHALSWSPAFLVCGLQIGFLSTVLIAINNLRDSESDKPAGKLTLAVRYGDSFVKAEIAALIVLTYLLSLYYLVFHNQVYVLLTYFLLPLAGFIIFLVYNNQDKAKLNSVLGLSALHQLLFAAFLSLGFLL